MASFTENVRSLCGEYGIAFTRMCREAKVSRSILSDIDSGRKKGVNIATAQKIADYFGVSVDRVLYGKRDESPSSAEATGVEKYLERLRTSSATRALLDATDSISEEQVQNMAEFIEMTRGGR